MNGCLLSNYKLSPFEMVQSLFIPEYGIRHWKQAGLDTDHWWAHKTIALVECVPILGPVVMFIERIAYSIFYQPSPEKRMLFETTQKKTGTSCGSINRRESRSIAEQLKVKAVPGISFNTRELAFDLAGGSCSAAALKFLKDFLALKKKTSCAFGYHSSDYFLAQLPQIQKEISENAEILRTQQAAFNTIQVTNCDSDTAKNKVQSLANFYDFKVTYASKELCIDAPNFAQSLKEEMDRCPLGCYLIRAITPANNDKLEYRGHSMIYVKDQFEGFFYSPCYGLEYMKDLDQAERIHDYLQLEHESFFVPQVRFYRLS